MGSFDVTSHFALTGSVDDPKCLSGKLRLQDALKALKVGGLSGRNFTGPSTTYIALVVSIAENTAVNTITDYAVKCVSKKKRVPERDLRFKCTRYLVNRTFWARLLHAVFVGHRMILLQVIGINLQSLHTKSLHMLPTRCLNILISNF